MQLHRMTSSSNLFLSIFLLFFFIISFGYSSSSFNKCSPQQSLALLLFKQNLSSTNHSFFYDDDVDSLCQDRLGSRYHPIMMNWNTSTDCCSWDGITCDLLTGDVIGIDLSCGMLHGTLHPNSTLFHLPHLQRLNLAFNDFYPSQLPHEIGRFSSSLTHLNISNGGFTSQIPSEITLLSKLVSLDLSSNGIGSEIQPSVFNTLLQNSTQLRELLVAFVDISWVLPTYINISSSLQSLDLSATGLQGKLPVNIFSLPYLQKLDLSYNYQLTGPLPEINLTPLTSLDLSYNMLNGMLPSWLFTLPSLEYIYLNHNMFSGGVPSELFNHSSTKKLYLRDNQFEGEIYQSSIQLIKALHLSHNNLTGVCDMDTLLSSLPSLVALDLSYSGISVVTNNVTHYANPNFDWLGLASCKLRLLPESLRSMKNLTYLDLSNNCIKGRIPDWVGEISQNWQHLNLSYNFITGLPKFHSDKLENLFLQSNQIEGQFPPSICNMSHLFFLDMSYNRFDGVIPQCFGGIISFLAMINMHNNRFHGTIPHVKKGCEDLRWFILSRNLLEGDVPSFLSKCRKLEILDIGDNQLNGTFPSWLGDLPQLRVIVLESNKLQGSIETSSTPELPFPNLRVLYLSHNRLVGHLPPQLFQTFSAMKDVVAEGPTPDYLSLFLEGNYYSLTLSWKGLKLLFSKVLDTLTVVDLSENKFGGEIPNDICSLNSLKVLNLSYNNFSGRIPHALGNLSQIESLDLSWNQLKGEIPQSLVGITTLEKLNLSHNRLVGRIPAGKQFNTFEENSFRGNLGLCGFPLSRPCEHSSSPPDEEDKDAEEISGFTWKVVTMGFECGTVIGLVMGYIMLSTGKPKWFNAIADAIEQTFLKRKNKRDYTYIGK